MLTYSDCTEYRSFLANLYWLQLQSRPDLSYEVNRATITDAIFLKVQRSSETNLRYPRGVVNVFCSDGVEKTVRRPSKVHVGSQAGGRGFDNKPDEGHVGSAVTNTRNATLACKAPSLSKQAKHARCDGPALL